jgi:hypothetical protein
MTLSVKILTLVASLVDEVVLKQYTSSEHGKLVSENEMAGTSILDSPSGSTRAPIPTMGVDISSYIH